MPIHARSSSSSRLVAWFVVAMALCTGPFVRSLVAGLPDSGPPLPPPTGAVVYVSTEPQLQAAVRALRSNTTIVLAPGTYRLTSTLWVNGVMNDVAIRGANPNRSDTVLVGPGMTNANYGNVPFGIWTGGGVTRVTIANLTIRDLYYHPIVFNAGTQQPRVYNVRVADGGQQLLKSNPDGAGGGVNGGLVQFSVFEYTTQAPSDYTNAIDVHTGDGWQVKHNVFRRIRSAYGLAGPAVLMWNNSRNSLIASNTFIDCHRDISLGLIERTPDDHTGGIVRNNMIARSPGAGGDVAIGVMDSPGTVVVHNSIWLGGAYQNAIEYRFRNTTGVTIANNLADGRVLARDGAAGSVGGNVLNAPATFFVNPSAGNLHLTALAAAIINKVTMRSDNPTDWDGDPRSLGGLADIGADEAPSVP